MPAERRTIVVTGAAGFVGFHLAHRLDDIVEALVRVTDRPAAPNSAWSSDAPDPGTSAAPYRIYNIGNHAPVKLTEFIVLLEKAIGKKAELNLLPMQPGDVVETFADVDDWCVTSASRHIRRSKRDWRSSWRGTGSTTELKIENWKLKMRDLTPFSISILASGHDDCADSQRA